MEPIKVDCVYKEQLSKDKTKTFKALHVKLADNYEKIVFLSVPEQMLLEKTYSESVYNNYYAE